jgi:hypothetical protein
MLVQQTETSANDVDLFSGDERSAQLTTWCLAPGGWSERCHVSLSVQPATAGLALAVAIGSSTVEVRRATSVLELRYLANAGKGGTWFRRWGASVSMPQAIGVLTDKDTLILPIALGSAR